VRLVGEAADGVEAAQKAEELQPDLILLDIGAKAPEPATIVAPRVSIEAGAVLGKASTSAMPG